MAKNSKTPKSKTTDLQRETRVLLEEIHQQVRTVAEGHGIIIRKLEEHDKRVEQMNQRFDRIEIVLTDTNGRVKKIEQDHGARLTKLEEKVLA